MTGPKVKLGELEDAFDCVCASDFDEIKAWVDRDTGAVFVRFPPEVTGEDPELPDDLDTNDRYLPIPARMDMNMDTGIHLVMGFAHEHMPEHADTISDIFRRRGAYRRFKDFLDQYDRRNDWHEHEARARRQALREWCQDNDIILVE